MGTQLNSKSNTKSPVSVLSIIRPRSSFFSDLWGCKEAEAARHLAWGGGGR